MSTVKLDQTWLKSVEVGDVVNRRMAAGEEYKAGPIHSLKITELSEKIVTCGAWTFDRATGMEDRRRVGVGTKVRVHRFLFGGVEMTDTELEELRQEVAAGGPYPAMRKHVRGLLERLDAALQQRADAVEQFEKEREARNAVAAENALRIAAGVASREEYEAGQWGQFFENEESTWPTSDDTFVLVSTYDRELVVAQWDNEQHKLSTLDGRVLTEEEIYRWRPLPDAPK